MYRIAFVIEQALGHVTHTKNLQRNVPHDPDIEPHWLLIPFDVKGLAARIPLYRSNWTVRAGWQARRALSALARSRRGNRSDSYSQEEKHRDSRQADLDGLFVHTQVPGVLVTDWVRRYPSVVSLDATPIQYDRLGAFYSHARGPEWLERIKWRLNRNLFLAADQLVVWTAWTKGSLVRDYGIGAEKITVIPPGVNPHEWARPAPGAGRSASEPVVRILFVGGNLARKGGHLLLDSFRALRDREPGRGGGNRRRVELHLVTRTPVEPEPGVHIYDDIVPNDPRLVQLYHQADIFALPTFGDCLPMVLSEAGAAGLPLVSTTVAGIPEIVVDGESGLLVPPHDGQALTKALTRLLEDADLRLQMGRRAAEIINERFDAERNAECLLAVIKATVDRVREA